MTIRTLIAMLPEVYLYWKLRLQIALDRMTHNLRMAENRSRFPGIGLHNKGARDELEQAGHG